MKNEILEKQIKNIEPHERARMACESLGSHCQRLEEHGFDVNEISSALFTLFLNSTIKRDGVDEAVQWLRDTATGIEQQGVARPN